MKDFLAAFIGDPFDHPEQYLFAYLAVPVVVTTVVALWWRRASKTEIAALSAVMAAVAFVLAYCPAYGVQSMIGLGFMIVLFVYSGVCTATVAVIRAFMRLRAT